ncbi:MAG: MFS transporter [Chloroflexi bacterium]|nr:MFS transporter [Chloroflexota bacterium]
MEQRTQEDIAREQGNGHGVGAIGTARGGRGSRLPTTFASLAYKNFVWLWLWQISHAFGLWMEQVAQPLLILHLTGSGTQLGLVLLTRTLPAVGFGMIAGVVADNFNRRVVLLTTKVIVLGLNATFAIFVLTGFIEVWHIYVFSFMRGSMQAFDQPARQAMIPTIVPAHLVTNAMSLSSGSVQLMRIAGAAAAGLLVGYIGLAAPFIVASVAYTGAVFFTWMLRPQDHERRGYRGAKSMGGDIVSGLRFAWGNPDIRGVLIVALGYFTFGMSFMQVFAPLFAKNVLDIGDSGFGYMVSFLGVGGIVGALAIATINPTKKRATIMVAMLFVYGLLLTVFSLTSFLQSIVLAFALVAVLGVVQAVFFPLINSLLVGAAPENMRGRVMGMLSLDRSMIALGGAMAGFLSDRIGIQEAQVVFGLACVATAAVMFVAYPRLRRID